MPTTQTRTVNAYAATKPGLEVEPFQYQARPLGVEDVEGAISHCGICGSDLHTISGGWGGANYPIVPGHEIIGTITAAGPDVKHLKDTCKECASDNESYCNECVFTYNGKYADGQPSYGGYAEYVRVPAHYAFKVPDVIPSDVAGPLLCAGVTVYKPLRDHVKPGQRVGVVGIGGLGHFGLQFIRALGAEPIAFSQSPNKEQAAREPGARSVDTLLVTADAKGQPYDTYLGLITIGGKLIMVSIPDDKMAFNAFSLVSSGISVVGSLIGGIKDTKDMLEFAAKENVRPVIQKLPMKEANQGVKMVDEGRVRYRVVLENKATPKRRRRTV
ncbi:hypothetical protein Poli38472_010785 [Pythium oligandrum]|uniref:Enoyl reductase (ER) domain-containing protein n=1 Tax=Pythium oligandrum TaxID=41045 RepID=A0A8K1CGH0_PYTOL|nr:hypothetical protein Poli38472_010785 [Pythium oligandrum]|eukprot:TMW61722.1 hypothetical protein Poli38472_010785 [Pythium oligandrum]